MSRFIALGFALLLAAVLSPSFAQAPKAPAPKRKPLQELVAELKHRNKDIVLSAAKTLASFGPRAAPAVKELVRLLETGDEPIRLQAAFTLGAVGAPAVPALVKSLESKNTDVQYYSLWALGRIGSQAQPALDPIRWLARDSTNPQVRRKAVYALGGLAAESNLALDAVTEAFLDVDPDVRQEATEALSRLGEKSLPALGDALKSTAALARLQAARTLGRLGPIAHAALPQLRELLARDRDAAVRAEAANTLVQLGQAVPVLIDLMKERDPAVRRLAVEFLGRLGPDAARPLLDAFKDEQAEVRRQAIVALGRMRLADRAVALALADGLGDRDETVRVAAITALADLGAEARPASPALVKALVDVNLTVRQQAYRLLNDFGADPRALLLASLKKAEGSARVATACLLLSEGIELSESIQVLAEALAHEDAEVRHQAAYTLALAGRCARLAAPVLLEGMTDPRDEVRQRSTRALVRVAGQAPEAICRLAEALRDKDPVVRQQAAFGLRQLNGDTATVLAALERVLQSKEVEVRQTVVRLLPRYGVEAVPQLLQAGKDPDVSVRLEVVHSLSLFDLRQEAAKVAPVAEQALRDDNCAVRRSAVAILAHQGSEAAPLLADTLLTDKDPDVRWTAASALAGLGERACAAIPQIARAAGTDANATVRRFSVHALSQMGDDGWPALIELLKAPQADVRQAVLEALPKLGPPAAFAIPSLVALLPETKSNERLLVIRTLGQLGPDATEAIPLLEQAAQDADADPAVRTAAEQALAKVRGGPQ